MDEFNHILSKCEDKSKQKEQDEVISSAVYYRHEYESV